MLFLHLQEPIILENILFHSQLSPNYFCPLSSHYFEDFSLCDAIFITEAP